MSKPGDDGGPPDGLAFEVLERAVIRALGHMTAIEKRVLAAEARSAELAEVVRRFTGDPAEGGRILTRLKSLEQENEELRHRLVEGREGVDRLLAKIRFLESQS